MSDYESDQVESECTDESNYEGVEHSYGDDDDAELEDSSKEDSCFEVREMNEDMRGKDDYYKKLQKDEEKVAKVQPEDRITNNVLSKYEKAKIAKNSPIYAHIDPDRLPLLNALDIAELELKQKAIPFLIRRFLPDGQFEEWKISELIQLN